jgi:hypothetical protein
MLARPDWPARSQMGKTGHSLGVDFATPGLGVGGAPTAWLASPNPHSGEILLILRPRYPPDDWGSRCVEASHTNYHRCLDSISAKSHFGTCIVCMSRTVCRLVRVRFLPAEHSSASASGVQYFLSRREESRTCMCLRPYPFHQPAWNPRHVQGKVVRHIEPSLPSFLCYRSITDTIAPQVAQASTQS